MSNAARSHIGLRLKEVRKSMKLTLAQVSRRSDVSASTLSKIENDQISPSFDIIKKISEGLGVSIEDFVRPGEKSVVSGRKTVTRARDGVFFTSGQYDYRAHATELSRKGMVPLELRIMARSVEDFDHWSRHNGEEFVYVLSGAIEIHTEHYAGFRLAAGESAYFDSGMAHVYVSVSEEDARVLSVSYDPDQGKERLTHFMNPAAKPVMDGIDRPALQPASRQAAMRKAKQ